jgi:hypothetical protein
LAKPLTDDQQDAILRAAAVLPVADRATFHDRVREQLAAVSEIGEGVIYRACATALKGLFKPPRDDTGRRAPHQLKRF